MWKGHRDTWGLAAILAATLTWMGHVLFGSHSLYYRDILLHLYPLSRFINESLQRGELPLWNPYGGGGFSQVAIMELPLFYPPAILFYYLPYGLALNWYLWLHVFLAAAGMYALGRHWGFHPLAATASGLTLGLSGIMASFLNIYNYVPAISLLPLVLLSYGRALERPRVGIVAAAGVAFALQTAGCRPDVTLMTVGILIFAGLQRIARAAPEARLVAFRDSGTVLAGMTLFALFLNACTLLPAWEFFQRSERAAGLAPEVIFAASLSPLQLITLIFPHFFGDPSWGLEFGPYRFGVNLDMYLPTQYWGLLPLLLLWPATRAPRHPRGLLLAIGAASFLLSLGQWTPLYSSYLQLFPMLRSLRYPIKNLIVTVFAVAGLVGLGLDNILRTPRRWRGYSLAAGTTWLLAAFGLFYLTLYRAQFFHTWFGPQQWHWFKTQQVNLFLGGTLEQHPQGLASALAAHWPTCLAAWWWGTGYLVLLIAWTNGALRLFLLATATVLLLGSELTLANQGFLYAADRRIFELGSSVGTFLTHNKTGLLPGLSRVYFPLREQHLILPGADGARFRRQLAILDDLRTDLPFASRRSQELLLFDVPMALRLDYAAVHHAWMPVQSVHALVNALRQMPASSSSGRLLGMLNISQALVPVFPVPLAPPLPRELAREGFRPFGLHRDWGALELQMAHWMPRAYLVPDALIVKEQSRLGSTLLAPGRRFDREAILTEDDALRATLALRRPGSIPGYRFLKPQVRFIDYGNNSVRIKVSSRYSGYLVLADNYYPGWKAFVDSERRPLLQANAVLRGVYVAAGDHVVLFRFLPLSLLAGLAISTFSLAGLGVILAFARRV